MNLTIFATSTFKKELKKAKKQHKNIELLQKIIISLQTGKQLSEKYKDHQLSGNYRKYRECHIESDWLLMYRIENYELQLARVGSHSELFG